MVNEFEPVPERMVKFGLQANQSPQMWTSLQDFMRAGCARAVIEGAAQPRAAVMGGSGG